MNVTKPETARLFDSKSILLLGNPIDQELLEILAEGFWQPQLLQSGKLPGGPPCSLLPQVGLVCIQSPCPEEMRRVVEAVTARQDLDWIAVVNAESAAHQEVREFIARHCVSYQTAPVDRKRLLYALGHAVGMRNLLATARGELQVSSGRFFIIGESAPIRQLRRDLLKIAIADAPVLLTGDSGTGKELAARTIHQHSRRADNDFVAINCAALSPSLIHAELFGAEKGAFTGAHVRRIGQLEAAHRGTVFLDEIGDLHPDMQGLLLRFLEEKSVRRLGAKGLIPVDVRVVAATNVDLEAEVKHGRFREDLYYRLNVIRVRMPALRDRREDVPLLAHTFLTRILAEHPRRIEGFSGAALAALTHHSWPGNVRELLNRIRRAVVLGEGRIITPADLQLDNQSPTADIVTLEGTRSKAERQALLSGLSRAEGNVREAATILGVSRATFYRLLEKHGVSSDFSDTPSHL